jgi:hypothetical protein
VQAPIATQATREGKHLLLGRDVGRVLAEAQRQVDARQAARLSA